MNSHPAPDDLRTFLERFTVSYEVRPESAVLRGHTIGQVGYGAAAGAVLDPDLVEWDYGKYEGLTTGQIHQQAPGWLIFRDGCPGGETPEQVGARADRVIARARGAQGDVALFAHGHVLRVLLARWLGWPALAGQHFLLDTGTLNVLDSYRGIPALKTWNAPLVGDVSRTIQRRSDADKAATTPSHVGGRRNE